MWEGVGDRTERQHIEPHSIGHNRVSSPFSWAAQPEAWGPILSGTYSSIQHLLSNWSGLQTLNRGSQGPFCRVLAFSTASCHQRVWFPNWLNFLCTQLFNSSTPTFSLWASQIALIQSIHGQGYTLLFLDLMHLLFTKVHFLFWQSGRVVGQYTSSGWIYLGYTVTAWHLVFYLSDVSYKSEVFVYGPSFCTVQKR